MKISQETLHITEQAISTSRDHLVYLHSCGLGDYPTIEDILNGAKIVATYLSQGREMSPDIKTYALDFAFSYEYGRAEEECTTDLSLYNILDIAQKIENEFPSICDKDS
jgi:hypothetical protein